MTLIAAGFLGETVAGLMRDQRTSVARVMRYSGLTRNAIVYIIKGKTRSPKPKTVNLLARGLASDPATGELNRATMRDIERKLAIAIWAAHDPTAREARSLLELSLYYVLNSRELAVAWTDAVARLKTLRPEAVRRLRAEA